MNLLLEAESAILIRVEEADQTEGLTFADAKVALIAEEGYDLAGAHKRVAVSVKSLEGRVWCEVANVTKTLTRRFEGPLTISDSDKQFFKSTFRLVSKAHFYL